MKINKLLLSIGTAVAIVAPTISIVSCGDSKPSITPPSQTPPVKGVPWTSIEPIPITPPSNIPSAEIPQDKLPPVETIPIKNANPTESDDGILDLRTNKIESTSRLEEALGRYSINMELEAKDNSILQITSETSIKMDDTWIKTKLLVTVNDTKNNGGVVFYAGVLGYEPISRRVYYTFKDFKKIDDIADHTNEESLHQLKLSKRDTIGRIMTFGLSTGISSEEIFNKILEYAKAKYPNAIYD